MAKNNKRQETPQVAEHGLSWKAILGLWLFVIPFVGSSLYLAAQNSPSHFKKVAYQAQTLIAKADQLRHKLPLSKPESKVRHVQESAHKVDAPDAHTTHSGHH
jgi:outer membrane murein-binding lipoprotein Lpp